MPVDLGRYTIRTSAECQFNPLQRLLTAEIEICGIKQSYRSLATVLKEWNASCVSDGSLPDGGFEINTHPAAGDFWTLQVNEIIAGVHRAQGWVDERAGCHIHVDCRDCGYEEMARVMLLACAVEQALFEMIPPARRASNYCIPCSEMYIPALNGAYYAAQNAGTPPLFRDVLLSMLYSISTARQLKRSYIDWLKLKKANSARYRAINLHSYIHRGTLEFRLPPGTIYAENIIMWGRMLGELVEYAYRHTYKDIHKLIHQKNGTDFIPASTILKTVFTDQPAINDWINGRYRWAKRLSTTAGFLEESPK
jgi:hypothetical protein